MPSKLNQLKDRHRYKPTADTSCADKPREQGRRNEDGGENGIFPLAVVRSAQAHPTTLKCH